MKIKRALVDVLERRHPIVRPEYSLLSVLYLLRMKGADVVPITSSSSQVSGRAVYGCSVLFQATQTGPAGFANLLTGPCLAASNELAMVSTDDDLDELLKAFKSKRLGFAYVHADNDQTRGTLVTVTDVLSLYSTQVIKTEMTLGDVASSIVSMPSETPLRDVLRLMYRHSYRRIFLTGERERGRCVFDREIMSHIFSPLVLEGPDPERLCKDALAQPIAEIEKTTPDTVSSKVAVRDVAPKLMNSGGGCVVVDGERVATPWDAVMKPWSSGELTV